MTRIERRLSELKASGRKALAAFITAGDPNVDASVPALRSLVSGGADILELGMPFSDPEAEGPSIQRSSERALAAGVTIGQIFAMVRAFRAEDRTTPVVLMGYLNSLERIGYGPFVEQAAAAGVDGLIIVNLPPEEAAPLEHELATREMNLIFLVAPTTTEERMALIAEHSSGFIYYVSLKGVTGANHLRTETIPERVARLKAHARHPVLVGFGIKDGAAAREVAAYADGVVVGSALVDTMARFKDDPANIPDALTRQVETFREALDRT